MKMLKLTLLFFFVIVIHFSASAQSVKKEKSRSIDVYKSKEVQPYNSSEIKSDNSKEQSKETAADMSSPEAYLGVWKTGIPGGVWFTPSSVQGYDVQHVSAGAASGDLIINKDGTYIWNSYGGKKGKWEKGDKDYPVVLIDNKENKRWKVGFDPKHTGGRDISIWDGKYYYYDGKR